jgi:hypothetical protein
MEQSVAEADILAGRILLGPVDSLHADRNGGQLVK